MQCNIGCVIMTEQIGKYRLEKVDDVIWEVSEDQKEGMIVPARIVASDNLMEGLEEGVLDQVTNMATLPGVAGCTWAHADTHIGYGAPVGGVAAFDLEEGMISPGMIGFDINCGMKLVRTNLTYDEVEPHIEELVNLLFKKVPAGVGVKSNVKLSKDDFNDMLVDGVKWCVENGYGWEEDIERVEEYGSIDGADPTAVSEKAFKRGRSQLGTLGSGNHYLEIQRVGNIVNEEVAKAFGIDDEDQVVIMVHCGSRGFGHQVATDYLRIFKDAMDKYNIHIPDKELACAPFDSMEGKDYYSAMACAANYAFANRQLIVHRVREAFQEVLGKDPRDMEMEIVYDVAHNIAKIEEYEIEGEKKKVIVHRKGATRSFGPNHPELTEKYKPYGQPVIVGGSMETGSYLLVGTKEAEKKTFGSTCHGSGRTMSRTQAKKEVRGDSLQKDMKKRGIYVKAASMAGLAEEAGLAYKDINEVVATCEKAGISLPVASFKPIGNVKG